MHRHTRSDTGEANTTMSARSSRAPSFSSDRPSVASSVTFQMPTTVRPAPAYIAASVASQIVTDAHNAQLRLEDADSDELENAVFSEQSLALLNAFLDHLLFAFLSSARSPSLTAIRPAISDVLKPRLAREAMEAADEELEGLLAGEDDDEFPQQDTTAAAHWDVEKVWKRTRLRIMVYTRLGELEDEDEERYVQQERGLSMDDDDDDDAGLVSWASAIFLTSVIEYVAEQTLLISGTAAYARVAAKMKKLAQQTETSPELAIERLVIEEPHVEKIALNSALGRLWRTWRKRVRSPVTLPGRGVRPVSSYSSLHLRKASRDTIDETIQEDSAIPEHTPTETEIASNIPLPQGDNDVNEIEVPGLADTFEDDDTASIGSQTPVQRPQRPSSVIVPLSALARGRGSNKERPISLPMRPAPPFTVPLHASPAPSTSSEQGDLPFETPMERMDEADSYVDQADDEDIERQREATRQQLESPTQPNVSAEAMVAAAAATAAAAVAAVAVAVDTSVHNSHIVPIQTREFDQGGESAKGGAEAESVSPGGYESEPKVLRSKRMSLERPGPPGVVRSFSKRTSSRRSSQQTPVATPPTTSISTQHEEGTSYLNQESSDDERETGHKAIGVARTSDVPILSTLTPSSESPRSKGKAAGYAGYVEVAPRPVAPISIPAQSTSASDAKPMIPERAIARVNPLPSQPTQSVQSAQINKHASVDNETTDGSLHSQSTISPPRKQEAPMPSSSQNGPMPSLQKIDGSKASQVTEIAAPHHSPTLQSSPTTNSPKRSPTRPADSPVTVAERQEQRTPTTSSSPRSQGFSHDRSLSDKASLKRVTSSSSSAKRSNGATAISSGRESTASLRSRGLSGRMSEEDREREFDSLVKGKDTVKFTLTPQNMRALDETPLPKTAEPPKPSSPPSSVTVYPRVNAEDSQFGTGNLPKRTFSRNRGPGPVVANHKPSPSRKVVSKPMAREARIDTESLRDFADFIRSTGPSPGQEKPVQPFVAVNGSGSTSSLGRHGPTSPPPGRADGTSTKSRINMEPRSPAGLSNGNNDLIDFIRQGPPNANAGQPRIPRNVAPFRSTVDSDQFDTMLAGHGNVESAFGSTSSTLNSKHSATTVNSRTGLIPAPGVVQPAYSNTPQQLSGSMASNEPTITRTRHRVKDPYAIDLSDEEDEDDDQLTALPPSNQPAPPAQPPKQESLMDFLNGMEPPSNSKPQPFMLSEETIAAARARAAASNTSLSSSNSTMRNGTGPGFGTISASSLSSDAPRAYKPRLQARAPAASDARAGGGSRTATSDLADFLRDSGPDVPRPRNASPPVPFGKVPEEKKSRKFWRSKKNEKTYGDLP
ncbi:hypothetical protein J1614_010190 [Plenodomus biglobosus]|nr:hypothetical protein J1614_010190 [Plenodomus biglobosus]